MAAWVGLRRFLLVMVGVYVLVAGLAWIFQRRLIYFPDARPVGPSSVT